eukprot:g5342.t1
MEGLWPREPNSLHRPSDLFDGLPRKSGRGRTQADEASASTPGGLSGGSENGSYHLSLLLEEPAVDAGNSGNETGHEGDSLSQPSSLSSPSAFDFVCSGSGVVAPPAVAVAAEPEEEQGGGRRGGDGRDEEAAVGFDRVCALRGEVVHIFTVFHDADDGGRNDKGKDGTASRRTTSVSLELEHAAERAAWNSTASCVVIGDVSGRLHFVTGEGTLIFSQSLARPITGRVSDARSPAIDKGPRAFSCIKFAAVSPAQAAGVAGAGARAASAARGVEELVAVSASMQLYHFTDVPFAAIEAACLAQDVAALKKLRASIRVSIADASESPTPSPPAPCSQEQGHPGGGRAADACVQSLHGGDRSRVFLVSGGGISVWQRRGDGGSGSGARSRHNRGGVEAGSGRTREGGESGGDSEGGGGAAAAAAAAAAPSAVPALGKLVKIDGIPRGELFGGGGAVSLEVSAGGRWIIVVDDRGGLSWWDARTLLRLGRWSWPTATAPGGGAFKVAEAVVLTSNVSGAVVDGRGGGDGVAAPPSSTTTTTHGDAGGGGDARPCLACVSADGEVRVLRLGADGAEELHRSPAAEGTAPGAQAGVITVPSRARHQFLLVTSDVASGKVAFQLGKEAVPRHRLQALLARGDFGPALELARANSMDETDVHAARLLALLRKGSGGGGPTAVKSSGNHRDAGAGTGAAIDGVLSPRFFEDARSLFEKLDSPAALGRACEAAVRTPLPTLEDVRKLLERMAGVLARLRTFELIEGGRRPLLPLPRPHGGGGRDRSVVRDASDGLMGGDGGVGSPDGPGKENEDGNAGKAGGGDWISAGDTGGDEEDGDAPSSPAPPHAAAGHGAADLNSTSLEEEQGDDDDDGDDAGLVLSEVARWLRFRTVDLVRFVGGVLLAGDVQAAAVAWRRHGRTDRGARRTAVAAEARSSAMAGGGGGGDALRKGGVEEGRRLEMALPGQLATVPAAAPPVLLGAWLRDEVLPWLEVAGVVAVREWAEHHAREVEALEKRPHGALLFVRAVAEGSSRVLGSAAELMTVHSAELAAAEATVAARLAGPLDHWKRWKPDGLDSLGRTLADLAHAWDKHRLHLPLSTFERLPRDVVLFRVLDRVQSPDWLPEEISHHVLPLAKRYGLDPDAVLLDYMRICADAMAPRGRPKTIPSSSSGPSTATASGGSAGATGATGAVGAGGGGSGGLTTEQRAVAVARCMSAGEGCRSELRSKAVLALANAASFPFSEGLRDLVQEALSWGGALEEELRRAATTLTLSQIVQRYHVTGFNLVDAPRATRLLRHVLAQVRCPTALDDGLQVASAYSHLSERSVYVEFLENLAGSYPVRQASADGDGDGDGGRRLAADLAAHRGRVKHVLHRVPAGDARRVAEEVLLYLVRLLEDLELDAVTAGLNPGHLWGCEVVGTAEAWGRSGTDSLVSTAAGLCSSGGESSSSSSSSRNSRNSSMPGETVALEPGSDAELAVLVAAAAAAVVAFLRETQQLHCGARGSEKLGNDFAAMANNLRRVSALQTDFGVFASLKTLDRPRGRACWNIMREGLVVLEEYLHGDRTDHHQHQACPDGGIGKGKGKGRAAAPAPRGVKKRGGGARGGGEPAVRVLPRLLHRARRLSELLGVAWPSVVSHLANEAASRGKVPEAVGLCHMLFRAQAGATMDERAAALALRDTAKSLSTFVANQAYMGSLRADNQAGAKARAAVLQAMAQSVRGLRQSAVLCGAQELPFTMDLLQGSEAVAAVLCRCEGGDELAALLATELSPSGAASPSAAGGPNGDGDGVKSSGSGVGGVFQAASRPGWDAGALAGLYKWYPGDGRVLPLEEALKLVSVFVRQEMRLRVALASGDAIAVAEPPSEGAPSSSTEELLASRWGPGLESATLPLLSFLQRMGAQQLCLRVVAGMAMPPPSAVDVLGDAFSGLADKVLEFNHIDCPLAIGYMLAMPTRRAYETFRRTIRYSSDDYGSDNIDFLNDNNNNNNRLRTLAGVGMYAARAWGNHDLLHQCIEVERDSHWWHVLTSLGIAFDNRGFSRTDRSQVVGEYQRSLVPALLERSGCDLALTLEFCERYSVGEAFPCLLYVDNQLGSPCVSPHDVSYQERVKEVLPSVHGLFLARMLRHMLETPGMICDRDYERLAFVHALLLSDKCQEEEEDPDEEIKRLEDSLEALAILKDYTSPWPLRSDGTPIVSAAADAAGEDGVGGGGGGGGVVTAPSASSRVRSDAAGEVYARRLPFMALVKEPWAVLEPQLRPDSVAKLVPLADPLGLGVGEFYSRLVAGMLTKGGPGGGPGTRGEGGGRPIPTFAALQPWLDKIKDPALACMTAQRVAAGMTRDDDRLEALRVAIGHAITAGSSPSSSSEEQEAGGGARPLALLPLPSISSPSSDERQGGPDDINKSGSGGGGGGGGSREADIGEGLEEEVEEGEGGDIVDALEQRALRLEHKMTAKARLGADMAERLSPYFLAGSTELLTKILVFAAESAADAALASRSFAFEERESLTSASPSTTLNAGPAAAAASTTEWMSSGAEAGAAAVAGSMSDFRRRATGALRAARAVADQRGMDPHDVETIIFRLAKGWICQQKAGGGGGSDRDAGVFVGAGLGAGGVGGGGGADSVFVRDAREERMVEDATLGLRAAFVLTVTFSDDAEDGNTSVCDSIVFMDLKSRISVLLAIARDGRKDNRSSTSRIKFRARLRALLALSALAPPTLVAEVMAGDKDGWEAQGGGLSSLSDLRRNVAYMAELEEARLPHKLEELADCPAEDIVRALRRDHRGERSLIPLMCDMLLDARSGDVGLWSPILADACRHDELRRVLVMRVFPRVVRSSVADAFARSGGALATSWEEALRAPLEELKARHERQRRKKEAARAAAAAAGTKATAGPSSPPAFPGASSTSFGASLFAMTGGRDRGKEAVGGAVAGRGGGGGGGGGGSKAAGTVDAGAGDGERPHEDVMAVVEQVVLLLGACPFPERLDLTWFSAALADLGPRFHALSVRVALGIPRPAARTAAVLRAMEEGGVAVSVVLDELCPPPAGGGSGVWSGGELLANQATLEAVFLGIDERREWAGLRGTRHFDTMVCTLVRAGRARGMVAASLAAGKREEAYSLCQMHYAVIGPEWGRGAGRGGADGARQGGVAVGGAGSVDAPTNALARFAQEFGLQLPHV